MTGHDRLDTDNANGETEDQLLLLSNENQQLQGEIQRLRDELEYQRIQPNVEDDFEVEGGLGESSSPLTTTSLDANANTVALDASHGSAQVADDHNTDGAPAPSSEDDKTSGTPHYRGPELVFDDENPHPRNSMSFMKWATENINDIEQVSDYKVKLSMCEKQLWDIVATKRPPPSTSNDEAGQVDINDTAPRRDTIEYLPNLMGNSAEGTPHSEDDNTIQIDNITDRSDPENNVIEAFLVGAEDDEEIFDATPIETALPWWKQRPLMCATSLLIIVVITAVAITSSNNSDIDLSPETQRICFTDRDELKSAVDEYIDTDCGHGVRSASCEVIAQKYGWPINFWCVGNVTDLSALFNLKQSFNEDIGAWDVSRVTNMSALFNFSTSFNRDLSSWDVSNVKSMHGMFAGAASFNGNMSTWNTSSVTTMNGMFALAFQFKGVGLESWDVSSVIDMTGTFYSTNNLVVDLSRWNTSSVTNMFGMFSGARSFNDGGIVAWDVSRVTDMQLMFYYATAFNGDLSNWDVSSVRDMSNMFGLATSFNQPLSSWNITNSTNMHGMFSHSTSFNQDLCSWREYFPYDAAGNIFKDSGCTFQDDPNEEDKGPFCASSC